MLMEKFLRRIHFLGKIRPYITYYKYEDANKLKPLLHYPTTTTILQDPEQNIDIFK